MDVLIPTRGPKVPVKVRGRPFAKGWKGGPGRPKGVQDKYTREIKQAILDATEYVGEEKAGEFLAYAKKKKLKVDDANLPRGISAYLVWIAREYPQVACALLARMMPQQITAEHKVEHTYHSLEEIGARLRELGLPAQRIYPLLEAQPVAPVEHPMCEVCCEELANEVDVASEGERRTK